MIGLGEGQHKRQKSSINNDSYGNVIYQYSKS